MSRWLRATPMFSAIAGAVLAARASLAGCTHSPAVIPPSSGPAGQGGNVDPQVAQRGDGSTWKEFTPNLHGPVWDNIVAGPDGNMWFVNSGGYLTRITMGGTIKEFLLPTQSPYDLTVGSDGKFYINDFGTTILRSDTKGASASFTIPSGDSTQYDGIATGPDGNVWFTEYNHLGKIDTKGKITEYLYPTQPNVNTYGGITAGPDGNVWFAESTVNAIGVFKISTGKITEYPIPQSCIPAPMVSASDGNLWFACLLSARTVGMATTKGAITLYSLGGSQGANGTTQFGAVGPDGAPWFASSAGGIVYRVDPKSHAATDYTPPGSDPRPNALAAGPDGNIWVTTLAPAHVEVLIFNIIKVKPDTAKLTGTGSTQTLVVTEANTKSWTANSSNPKIATVSQGGKATEFVVKSVAKGKCTVTISDAIGNSAKIPVTVQ